MKKFVIIPEIGGQKEHMEHSLLFTALFVFLFSSCGKRESAEPGVSGVREPLIRLDGNWHFSLDPPEGFWETGIDSGKWAELRVPGEPAMQGYRVEHDKPVAYVKNINIPRDYNEKKVFLRFDGVYSYARLWVNGHFIREHKGGFTRWYADISPYVRPGKHAMIAVEVTDKKDDISYGSGYAKHPIGGILRSVFLEAKPPDRLAYWNVRTDLDEDYKNATLHIDLKAVFDKGRAVTITFRLLDPSGKDVFLKDPSLEVTAENPEKSQEFFVGNPRKWSAEHPVLYTLQCRIREGGKRLWTGEKKIGFRKVEILERQLLVNGRPVKLRGACRHDMHPELGRAGTRYYDSIDAVLAKEANINFIRTSHYPPTEDFVAFCDQLGIYVECESAVCFVDTHRGGKYAPGASENDPAYRDQYILQIEEMVSVFRDHPSVIIWSLGNESRWGSNFEASRQRLKELEPFRPVMASYPGLAPDSLHLYDILSMHYPDTKGNLGQYGKRSRGFTSEDTIPALFDEWAHVACYNTATLREDPNVRNFWGMSLDRMWGRCFISKGGLGGAIWGYVDETFTLPDTCTGYGEWGIIDTWRRKKPEFWNVKKAYSPFKLPLHYIVNYKPWEPLKMPLANRFDHINLNELTVKWDIGSQYGTVDTATLNIPPHKAGMLVLPAREWKAGEVVNIEVTLDGRVIDRYSIPLTAPPESAPGPAAGAETTALVVEEDGANFTVEGEGFSVKFSSADGMIHKISAGDERLVELGPFLQFEGKLSKKQGWGLMRDLTGEWQLDQMHKKLYDDSVVVTVAGRSGNLPVQWQIKVNGYGVIDVSYTVSGFKSIRLRELGVKWKLANGYDSLEWKRIAYWSLYPAGHPGAPSGKAALMPSPSPAAYRSRPAGIWSKDTRDYFLFGKIGAEQESGLSNMAKALKENIYFCRLTGRKGTKQLTVLSGGQEGCRIRKEEGKNLVLVINNLWDYPDLNWGNYMREVVIENEFSGHVRLYAGKKPLVD